MKTHFCCIILFQVWIFDLQAQGNFLQDYRQVGKPIEATSTFELEGSPFLLQTPSLILMSIRNTTNYLKVEQGFYNIIEERIEYTEGGKRLFLDPGLFKEFLLIANGDTLHFKNALTGEGAFSKNTYFQILFEGTSTWVKKPVKTLVNSPDATYGSTKQKMVQDELFYYVISQTGDLEKFKPSKKFFLKRYPQWEGDLNAFIREKGINFDRDADLRLLIGWLEQKQ